MIGLKKGIVILVSHNKNWKIVAQNMIETLRTIFKETAIDIQHIGSTSIQMICAKPIIDIVIGVENLDDVKQLIPTLKSKGIIFRGQDVLDQLLFVIDDLDNNVRTHHIHIVPYNGKDWNNYLNFRDYLNANSIKAKEYENLKLYLANQYPTDRTAYTSGKNQLIEHLLKEANELA